MGAVTLTEFLLARVAQDEAPAREAFEMDARLFSPQDAFSVQYQWARLIHHTSGLRYGYDVAQG